MKYSRILIRESEFHLPLSFSSLLMKNLLPNKNPYKEHNHLHKAIFIHIPKTAGISMVQGLFGKTSSHIPILRYKIYDEKKFDEYFKFCFVRNPYSRIFSAYNGFLYVKDSQGKDENSLFASKFLKDIESFEEFILKIGHSASYRFWIMNYIHFRPQHEWISLPGANKVAVDYIGRFENLKEEYQFIAKKFNRPSELPERKSKSKKDFREFYTPEMIDIVTKLYFDDLKLFDYKFE